MKVFSRVSLLTALTVLAMAVVAASAQAESINPPGPVTGLADNPTLSYGSAVVVCDTGTASGTADGSDTIPDLALAFQSPCSVSGAGAATVSCSGTASLIAEDATTDRGRADLNDDFSCTITVGSLCTISVAGPQTTNSGGVVLDETNDVLSADVTVNATRAGSFLCGPASGPASFAGEYVTTPANLTIDP